MWKSNASNHNNCCFYGLKIFYFLFKIIYFILLFLYINIKNKKYNFLSPVQIHNNSLIVEWDQMQAGEARPETERALHEFTANSLLLYSEITGLMLLLLFLDFFSILIKSNKLSLAAHVSKPSSPILPNADVGWVQ